jgi:hypothetical protein
MLCVVVWMKFSQTSDSKIISQPEVMPYNFSKYLLCNQALKYQQTQIKKFCCTATCDLWPLLKISERAVENTHSTPI